MKLSKHSLFAATSLLVSALAFSAACTVTTGDDDDDPIFGTGAAGGLGGMGSGGDASGGMGGDASGGSATGGMGGDASGGTGGSTGVQLACTEDPESDPASPTEDVQGNACLECLQQECADAYARCFAWDPASSCGWDLSDEETFSANSELSCMQSCFVSREEAAEFTATEDDVDACVELCKEDPNLQCDGTINEATVDITTCMVLGQGGIDDLGCVQECIYDEVE